MHYIISRLIFTYLLCMAMTTQATDVVDTDSVGIGLKELGVTCRNVWNFAQGLKVKNDFH